jgi:hypothetical protein
VAALEQMGFVLGRETPCSALYISLDFLQTSTTGSLLQSGFFEFTCTGMETVAGKAASTIADRYSKLSEDVELVKRSTKKSVLVLHYLIENKMARPA